MLTGIAECTPIEALQVEYDAAKEEIETALYNLIGKSIVDTIQQGRMESLLTRNIQALTQPNRVMDALT